MLIFYGSYWKSQLIKICIHAYVSYNLSTFIFLKIPPTTTHFFETSVNLSRNNHGLCPKWNWYSFNLPLRKKKNTELLTIYVSKSWPILYIISPPPKRNLYKVIWHNSVFTPEFSHLFTTHNTIHVTEIQFSALQLRSVSLFVPVYFCSSQRLTTRLTCFLLLHAKRQARDQYCRMQVNGVLTSTSYEVMPPRKERIHFLAILQSTAPFPLLAFIPNEVIGTFISIVWVSRRCLSTTCFHFIVVFIYIWHSEDE